MHTSLHLEVQTPTKGVQMWFTWWIKGATRSSLHMDSSLPLSCPYRMQAGRTNYKMLLREKMTPAVALSTAYPLLQEHQGNCGRPGKRGEQITRLFTVASGGRGEKWILVSSHRGGTKKTQEWKPRHVTCPTLSCPYPTLSRTQDYVLHYIL